SSSDAAPRFLLRRHKLIESPKLVNNLWAGKVNSADRADYKPQHVVTGDFWPSRSLPRALAGGCNTTPEASVAEHNAMLGRYCMSRHDDAAAGMRAVPWCGSLTVREEPCGGVHVF